jgi:hypothetical protein
MMHQPRASGTAPDQAGIYTADEKEYYNILDILEQGVEITPGVQRGLKNLIIELHLPDPKLGF